MCGQWRLCLAVLGLTAVALVALPATAQVGAPASPASDRQIEPLRRVVQRLRAGHLALYARVEQLEKSAAAAEARQRALTEGAARLRREAEQARLLALAGVALGSIGLVFALAALLRRRETPKPAVEVSLEPLRARLRTAESRLRALEQENAGLTGEPGA